MIQLAKTLWKKWSKDNVGMLASVIAWNCLTSLVPIMVGLLAIAGLILQGDPTAQRSVVSHLSAALQGVLTPKDLTTIVKTSTRHAGLLGIVGFAGILWGGSNVGGAMSTAFQAIFETSGRNFIKEKLLDVVMIFVIAVLMIVIIVGTTAAAIVTNLFKSFPLSGASTLIVGTLISAGAAFLLFAAIYIAFPNVKMRLRLDNVWKGALTGAILFTALSYMWPVYAHFANFSKYGAVLFPILMLTAWLYFFAMIVCIGAEMVAIGAIHEARDKSEEVGPAPGENVPQHQVLRSGGEPPAGDGTNIREPQAVAGHR